MKKLTLFLLLLTLLSLSPSNAVAKDISVKGMLLLFDRSGKSLNSESTEFTVKETGQTVTVNSEGSFIITIPESLALLKSRINISINRPGWIIQTPLNGDLKILPDDGVSVVEVRAFPKAAKEFLSVPGVEQIIEESIGYLRRFLKRDTDSSEISISRYLRSWSERHGMDISEVTRVVDDWYTLEQESADPFKRALTAFIDKRYGSAAELFLKMGNGEKKAGGGIETLERGIRFFRLSGHLFYLDSNFKKALLSYGEAEKLASEKGDIGLWANVMSDTGLANSGLAEKADRDEIQRYLLNATDSFKKVIEILNPDLFKEEWGEAQKRYGVALHSFGIFTGGAGGVQLMDRAISAYNLALKVLTRDYFPGVWAETHRKLARVIRERGVRSGGDESLQLLSEGLKQTRMALLVNSLQAWPYEWAEAVSTIGQISFDLGIRSPGKEGVELLKKALASYRQSVRVYSRDSFLTEWAAIQDRIGFTANELALRLKDRGEAARFFEEAEDAFNRSMEVYTRADFPEKWAMARNNLGMVCEARGRAATGEEGTRYLKRAVESYRQALEVYTERSLAQDWARTHSTLGRLLRIQGTRTRGSEGLEFLSEAAESYRESLKVYTKNSMPHAWARAYSKLGEILMQSGARSDKSSKAALLKEAAGAFNAALAIFSKKGSLNTWAETESNLAELHVLMESWEEAAKSYSVLVNRSPDRPEFYQSLEYIYHEKMFAFDKALELTETRVDKFPGELFSKANLAEDLFTSGKFSESEKLIGGLLAKSGIDADSSVALQAINIANTLAQGGYQKLKGMVDGIISRVSEEKSDFRLNWSFFGFRYFMERDNLLKPYKEWLSALLDAVNQPTRDRIVEALRSLPGIKRRGQTPSGG